MTFLVVRSVGGRARSEVCRSVGRGQNRREVACLKGIQS